METQKIVNEAFRLAFSYLRSVKGGELKDISKKCGCTTRHLHNILSPEKAAGSSREMKEGVAEFYGTCVESMLTIGVMLQKGEQPRFDADGKFIEETPYRKNLRRVVTLSGDDLKTEIRDNDFVKVILNKHEYELLVLAREVLSPIMMVKVKEKLIKEKKRQENLGGFNGKLNP